MERVRNILYIPYLGRAHPRYTSFARSRINNPLEEKFQAHITRTKEVLAEVNRLRTEVKPDAECYRNRPWFVRMSSLLELMVDKVQEYRRSELDNAEFKRYLVLVSALEIVCSIILFSRSRHFQSTSDLDIEWLRIPVSKSSRMIIDKVIIQGEDFRIKSDYLWGVSVWGVWLIML